MSGTYIVPITQEEDEKNKAEMDKIMKELGLYNASAAKENEKEIEAKRKALLEEEERKRKETEEELFKRKFEEEQKRRAEFEEELRQIEEEKKKREEEKKKKSFDLKMPDLNKIKKMIPTDLAKLKDKPKNKTKEEINKKKLEKQKKINEAKEREKLKKISVTDIEDSDRPDREGVLDMVNKNISEQIKETPKKSVKKKENPIKSDDNNNNNNNHIRPPKARKISDENHNTSFNNNIRSVAPVYNINNKKKEWGALMRPESENTYLAKEVPKEILSLKDEIANIKAMEQTDMAKKMLHEMYDHKDDIMLIAIISNDMENLMLMTDIDKFLDYCEKMEDMVTVSYVYALYSDVGPVYYLRKPEEKFLNEIFQAMSNLFLNNKNVTGKMLSSIPNIGIFKHIYI